MNTRMRIVAFALGLVAVAGVASEPAMQNAQKAKAVKHAAVKRRAARKKAGAKPANAKITAVGANPQAAPPTVMEQQLSARPYLLAATDQMQKGNMQEAEAQCRSAMSVGPKDANGRAYANVRQLLAEILIKEGKYAEAAGLLDDVRPRRGPRGSLYPTAALLDKALVAVRSGDYATALAVDPAGGIEPYYRNCQGVMENAPGVADARHLEATILLMKAAERGSHGLDAEEAANAFAADRLVPGNALISYVCAKCLRFQGRFVDAERYLKLVQQGGKGGLTQWAGEDLYGVSYLANQQRQQAAAAAGPAGAEHATAAGAAHR